MLPVSQLGENTTLFEDLSLQSQSQTSLLSWQYSLHSFPPHIQWAIRLYTSTTNVWCKTVRSHTKSRSRRISSCAAGLILFFSTFSMELVALLWDYVPSSIFQSLNVQYWVLQQKKKNPFQSYLLVYLIPHPDLLLIHQPRGYQPPKQAAAITKRIPGEMLVFNTDFSQSTDLPKKKTVNPKCGSARAN